MMNKAKKAVSKAVSEKAVEKLFGWKRCPRGMFRLVKELKTDSIEVEGRRCMRGSDGKLCFKRYDMEGITNDEYDWDNYVEGHAVEGP